MKQAIGGIDSGGIPSSAQASTHKIRDVVAANVGTFFEWFDLLVYAMFAITISHLFFPTGNPQSALLYSLLTFASAYVVRPVGAVVLGIYADKRGRRAALTIAAFLMLCGTVLMAVIPTYRMIGAWAPALLVFGRLLQGFSVGGEFGCANSYLTEQNSRTKAFFASLQFSTSGLAVLTASLFAYLINHYLSQEQVDSWGWRTPFIFGCLIGPVGLYIRTKINETREFEEVADKPHRPLAEVFTFHKRFLASIFSGLVSTIFPIFGGLAADRFGTIKVMRIALIAGLIMVFPMFFMLTHTPSFQSLILFQCAMSLVFYSFYYAPVGSLLSQLFPTSCRTTGVSIAYVASQTFFGGVTPLVVGFLVAQTGSIMSPAYYVIVIGVVALVGLSASRSRAH
jgi:MHS family proline/betaine transporter-like MFS transporter